MESLLSLPPRTGDPTRDLEAIYKYLADLKFYLEGVLSDDTETQLGGIGGDTKVVSDLVIPPIDFGPPTVPQGLTATGLYQAIGLTWQIVMDATIAGYEIQRADDLPFTIGVKTLTRAKALHFIDDLPGQDGVTFYYRIQALRGTTTLTPSGFSAVVSATTRPAAQALIAAEEFGTALQSLHLKDAIIETAHIGDAIINEAHIADGSITTAKIADLAVTTAKIALANITTALIQDAAISSAKINDAAIITAKIADAAIVEAKIVNLQVTEAKIANLAISEAKIANAAVTNAKIANLAVDTGKITDLAVTNAKLANATIDSAKIGVAAIGTANIQDGAITSAKIQNATIQGADIGTATITGANIANASIGSAQIADASIQSADIQSLTADKLTSGTISTAAIDIAASSGINPLIRLYGPGYDANGPLMYITDGGGVTRVLLGNLRVYLGAGTTKYGLIVWNGSGQIQFNTEDGGVLTAGIKDAAINAAKIAAQQVVNAAIGTGAVDTRTVAAGAITQTIVGAGSVTLNLTNSYQQITFLDMTTSGGVVEITAIVYATCTVATSAAVQGMLMQIRHQGTGAVSQPVGFQLPTGVGNVALTLPCTMLHTPSAGSHRWILEALQGAGSGQYQVGPYVGGIVKEYKR